MDAGKLRLEDTDADDEWSVRYGKTIIGTVVAVPFIPGWYHGKLDQRIAVTKPSRLDAAAALAMWCGY